MRMLLVEDDTMIRDSLNKTLAQDGHAADCLRDGGSADHALRIKPFDGALLDIGLPNRGGLDFPQLIRTVRGPTYRMAIK